MPLHYSAMYGNEAAIKALVAAKADVHAKTRVRDGRRGAVLEGERGAASGLYFADVVGSFEDEVVERPNPVNHGPNRHPETT